MLNFQYFRGVEDNLASTIAIATTCLMADIINLTNKQQTFLHSATIDWCQVPKELKRLLKY